MMYKNSVNKMNHKQRGLSIIEALAWLALFAIVILAVMKKINSGNAESRLSTSQDEISGLYSAASRFKGISPAYTGVSCDTLVTDKYYDVGWSSCSNVNPYGGSYTVAVNGSNPTHLDITSVITGDSAACKRLANSYSKVNTASCSGTTLTVTFTN